MTKEIIRYEAFKTAAKIVSKQTADLKRSFKVDAARRKWNADPDHNQFDNLSKEKQEELINCVGGL